MEVADVEEEKRRLSDLRCLWFSNRADIAPWKWEELESHNYLRMYISYNTNLRELGAFLPELLNRRDSSSLEATLLEFDKASFHTEKNAKLIICLAEALSPTSRAYLE